MTIVYSPRSLRDIDGIRASIQNPSPRGAHKVSLAIEYTIQLCALNPRAASKTDEPNVYRRALGRYRYTIFYRALANDTGIEIARVIYSGLVKDLRKVPDDD